jgi:hypothetical protein
MTPVIREPLKNDFVVESELRRQPCGDDTPERIPEHFLASRINDFRRLVNSPWVGPARDLGLGGSRDVV